MIRQRKPLPDNSKPMGKTWAGATSTTVLGPASARSGLPENINPKWAWHYRTLMTLGRRLALQQGGWRLEALQPLEPHSQHMADSASDEFDHDVVLSEMSATQEVLYEIEEALQRILNGTYGVCEETNQPIPAARLRAIPWTRFAKATELRLEKEGGLAKTHMGRLGSVRGTPKAGFEENEGTDDNSSPPSNEESLRII